MNKNLPKFKCFEVPPSPGLGEEETHVTELRAAVER